MGKGTNPGTPLSLHKLKQNKATIQTLAVEQLLHTWHEGKHRSEDPFLWGDELECILLRVDGSRRRTFLIRPPWDRLNELKEKESSIMPELQPEFGSFMIETCPQKPHGPNLKDLLNWQSDLERRRVLINSVLDRDCYLISLPYYPHLGREDEPELVDDSPHSGARNVTDSDILSDEAVTKGVRYEAVTRNIVANRGKKVNIRIPVFIDEDMPQPWKDPTNHQINGFTTDDNTIHMDATTFGACGCSLQVTMQGKDVNEARKLHDQLIPIAPVMLALTVGSPIFRGVLADIDSRWPVFEQAVDDRTEEEQAIGAPARSRVSTSTTYIADDPRLKQEYQLPDLEVNLKVYERLVEEGMPARLATHFAHIFDRDPLLALEEDLADPDITTNNFSNALLSNVYQLLRFETPTSPTSGWRVEFRPIEAQPTDFANAAFAVFIVLVARTILHFDLNLYIPLALVEKNVNRACVRDAVRREKFCFRGNTMKDEECVSREMSAEEIMCGTGMEGEWEGLVELVREYVKSVEEFDEGDKVRIEKYLRFVANRASGREPTTARWLREFVQGHPEYKKDSVVTQGITLDIVNECVRRSRNALEFVEEEKQ